MGSYIMRYTWEMEILVSSTSDASVNVIVVVVDDDVKCCLRCGYVWCLFS